MEQWKLCGLNKRTYRRAVVKGIELVIETAALMLVILGALWLCGLVVETICG